MRSKLQKEAVFSRLHALFAVVEEEASRNPAFFERIENVLLSSELVIASQQKATPSPKPPGLNLVEVIHREGKDAAKEALSTLTNDEIVRLASADGIKKPKEAKAMEREALIELLLHMADKRLRQGESFTKG
jgi:hypothetical protein